MGLTVDSYTTEQGITITQLYLSIESFRYLRCLGSSDFAGTYQVAAYVSRVDKYAGKSPVSLPNYLTYVEVLVSPGEFSSQTPQEIGYARIKSTWEAAGYIVHDVFEPVPEAAAEPAPEAPAEPAPEAAAEPAPEAPAPEAPVEPAPEAPAEPTPEKTE